MERRDRQPAARRRALPRLAHDRLLRRATGARRSTRSRRWPRRRPRSPGEVTPTARDRDRRPRRPPPRRPRDDRRPARRDRPPDPAVVPARPPARRSTHCGPRRRARRLGRGPGVRDALRRASAPVADRLRRRPRVAAIDAVARAGRAAFDPPGARARCSREIDRRQVRRLGVAAMLLLLRLAGVAARLAAGELADRRTRRRR